MKGMLIDDASVWHKLWSIRLALIAAIFAAIEATLPLWDGLLPPHIFATLATLAGLGSAISRVIKQAGLDPSDESEATDQQ